MLVTRLNIPPFYYIIGYFISVPCKRLSHCVCGWSICVFKSRNRIQLSILYFAKIVQCTLYLQEKTNFYIIYITNT